VETFASKPAPAGDKLRGGYYTPDLIARFLADWVAEAGPRLLEPSCGDGGILKHLAMRAPGGGVVGVELFEDEAAKAQQVSGASVFAEDFFSWFSGSRRGAFDGVAGNPPYIRFGSWEEAFRAPALDLMRGEGMRPTKLTNAWVPFVVASVLAVRPGGRVGLVLPAELLQVGYASALRAYLVDSCADITVVSFTRLVFPGILQEVVLLLAERGQGPARIRTIEVADAQSLGGVCITNSPTARAHLHESEKWTQYYLEPDEIEVLRSVRTDGRLAPLLRYAEVDVGVVSGRNSFFCMTTAEAADRGLLDVTVPIVSRSMQVPALSLMPSEFAAQEKAGAKTRLLSVPAGFNLDDHPSLQRYLREGEEAGVQTGYKCRIRRSWWQVPSAWVPDGFMLRQISTHPRLTSNHVGATSTDTVHRVRVRPDVEMDRLATGAFNSATFALAEVLGRSYGGGILELEPSEAEHLPVPDPSLVPHAIVAKADELIRERRIEDALDLVDQTVLVDALNFDPAEVARLRDCWVRLRDRRSKRGRRG